jgi:hypothetical protein
MIPLAIFGLVIVGCLLVLNHVMKRSTQDDVEDLLAEKLRRKP